jgi:hypothetical protein
MDSAGSGSRVNPDALLAPVVRVWQDERMLAESGGDGTTRGPRVAFGGLPKPGTDTVSKHAGASALSTTDLPQASRAQKPPQLGSTQA